VSPLFHDLDGRGNLRRNKSQNWSAGRNERRNRSRQYQREGVDRPDGIVVVVIGVRDLRSSLCGYFLVNRVEVSVDNGRLIVIRSRPGGVNVLKRRDNKCR
jgi:hypothetical protein